MAPSSVPWQAPWVDDTKGSDMAASLHRTMSWVASTHAFESYPIDCQDPPAISSIGLPADTAFPPPDPAPSICDNLSELSDFSDGSDVR